MNPGDISHRKQLRQAFRQARRDLSAENQQQAAQLMVEQLTQLGEFDSAKKLAIYLANDGEPSLALFAQACWQTNKQLYLPVIHPFSGKHLLFVEYNQTTELKQNKFSILEPLAESHRVCPPSALDICFMPLVAFDNQGNRLGMGGGFYDRSFANKDARCSPALIGIAHPCQLAASLPQQSWDVPLDLVVTSERIYRFK